MIFKQVFVFLLFVMASGSKYEVLGQSKAEQLTLQNIHPRLLAAVSSARVTDSLIIEFVQLKHSTALTTALLGYVQCVKARHIWNPVSKLAAVLKGSNNLNKGVAMQPHNTELRYLRYAIEANIPAVLGCSGHTSEDKAILVHYIEIKPFIASKELQRYICSLFLDTPHTSRAEKEFCQAVLRH